MGEKYSTRVYSINPDWLDAVKLALDLQQKPDYSNKQDVLSFIEENIHESPLEKTFAEKALGTKTIRQQVLDEINDETEIGIMLYNATQKIMADNSK